MVRLMSSSLPGIGEDERTTVSPGWISMWRWSRFAIRTSAEVGSPCAPVVIIAIFSGASFFILSSEASTSPEAER